MSKICISLFIYDEKRNSYIRSTSFCYKNIQQTRLTSEKLSICATKRTKHNCELKLKFTYDAKLIKSNGDTAIKYTIENYYDRAKHGLLVEGIIYNITIKHASITGYNLFINLYNIYDLAFYHQGRITGIRYYDNKFIYLGNSACPASLDPFDISKSIEPYILIDLQQFLTNSQIRTFILDAILINTQWCNTLKDEMCQAFNTLTLDSIRSNLFLTK